MNIIITTSPSKGIEELESLKITIDASEPDCFTCLAGKELMITCTKESCLRVENLITAWETMFSKY